ncbi:MAG: NAD(P)/FAD-dependent oxidoreductase [Actinomycetota bacterium]
MAETFVIVGASLAGGSAAATLREEGFDGDVVLIGAEAQPPYERPPLSKEYLRGEAPFEKALVRPADFYGENEIQTRFGSRVNRVDPEAKRLHLEDGGEVPFDRLLIATGSRNRKIPFPGIDLEGVYDLRTVEDCDRLREEAASGEVVAIVGMGFIGAEVAASFRQMGLEVEVVEAERAPLSRVFGEDIGRVIEGIHRDHGVRMHFGEGVASFEGGGRVERVVTAGGRQIDCDFALVGVGVVPATEAIEGSGIEIENGIVVDEQCRTNVSGVFAAGDVTNHQHPLFGRRMRVEHWQNALRQGPAAARNMMGKQETYDEVHWFWSDQYDHNLQYAGVHGDHDEAVTRGSLESRNFTVFYLKQGRIEGAFAVDRGREVRAAMRLITSRLRVDPAALREDETDLRKIAAGEASGR